MARDACGLTAGIQTLVQRVRAHDPTLIVLEDARRGLEAAVHRVSGQFSTLVRRTEWTPDRQRVKFQGVGFWLEMWVDAQAVPATGDIAILGGLLGGQLAEGLKQIVQQTFPKKLP